MLYVGLCLATGWASGWWRLAKHYRRTTQKDESWHPVFLGFVGSRGYNWGFAVSPTAEGLVLEANLLGRIGHPPLFFPWGDASVVCLLRGLVELRRYQFRFAKADDVVVELSDTLGDKILAEAARRGATNVPVVE